MKQLRGVKRRTIPDPEVRIETPPSFKIFKYQPPRRCDTGEVVGELGECAACNAANGEHCRKPVRP